MKKTIWLAIITSAFFLACNYRGNNNSISFSSDGDGKKGKTTITVNDQTGSLKIESKGEIHFTDDDQGIAYISPGGYVKYTRNGRKLLAENGAGAVVYKLNSGAETDQLNEEGRKFLAEAVRVMINHGIDAEARVIRLYNKGGNASVLDETAKLESDYVKGLYLDYLLSTHPLTRNEMLITAHLISTSISSDYEKSKLLEKYSSEFLKDSSSVQAFLVAVKSIDSDYEKAKSLKSMISKPMTAEQLTYAFSVVNSIDSDYEKAGVLKELLSHGSLNATQTTAALKSTALISSDYEKAEVLKALFSKTITQNVPVSEVLPVISGVQSDYEKSEVFKQLLTQPVGSEDDWVAIIEAASGIGSEYEKANVLVAIAGKMSPGQKTKDALLKAAKTIGSDQEYARIVRAAS